MNYSPTHLIKISIMYYCPMKLISIHCVNYRKEEKAVKKSYSLSHDFCYMCNLYAIQVKKAKIDIFMRK